MKVVRVIARLNVGGPARHVILVDRELRRRGHTTLLVHGQCGPGEASMADLLSAAGNPFVSLPALRRRIRVVGDIAAFWQLLRVIWRTQPDIVHTHTAKAGALGRLAVTTVNWVRPRRRRAALVHTFHGHVLEGYFSPIGSRLVRIAERLLARLTDRIIVLSPEQKKEIVERFRIAPAEKVVVVPLGLDLDSLLAVEGTHGDLRRELGVNGNEFVVGYMGRLVPIKNLSFLVDAFADFSRRTPSMLLIAGDGPEKHALEARLVEQGIGQRTRLLGWCSRLAEFYGAVDVVALSSLNEGTPVALIEAMAAGRPVVATAVGGVPDIVQHGTNGLVITPGDRQGFIAALQRLARDPDERAAMGRRGREHVRACHSIERLVANLECLYDDTLQQVRRSAPLKGDT